MYGYFDESIVDVENKKYCFLGFIAYNKKCTEKLIHNESSKTKHTLQNKKEIKYTNIRKQNIRDNILDKIKQQAEYYSFDFSEITEKQDIHKTVNMIIHKELTKF